MDLRKLLLTKNECYLRGVKITPKGIMWHSTGANNPNLKRYVGPDDGRLGVNNYGNHWNQYRPDNRQVCVHAFIGKDKDGNVCTYQTLPWNFKGWHAGGSANNSYIGFEMCEDGLTDSNYFNKVYKEAVELTAYLCKLYNLNPLGKNVIICHQDGYKLGIASNHGDVYTWFNKHGKTMDDVRRDVKNAMGGTAPTPTPSNTGTKKSVDEVAREVINGKWGTGAERKAALEKAGYNYSEVQARVNALCGQSSNSSTYKVQVTTGALNIRAGAGTGYKKTGVIRDRGVYTIVATSGKWGRLKSGKGWICLDYTKRV